MTEHLNNWNKYNVLKIVHNKVKNSNWQEADQLAIYKRGKASGREGTWTRDLRVSSLVRCPNPSTRLPLATNGKLIISFIGIFGKREQSRSRSIPKIFKHSFQKFPVHLVTFPEFCSSAMQHCFSNAFLGKFRFHSILYPIFWKFWSYGSRRESLLWKSIKL